jgi:hypothetical protein
MHLTELVLTGLVLLLNSFVLTVMTFLTELDVAILLFLTEIVLTSYARPNSVIKSVQ